MSICQFLIDIKNFEKNNITKEDYLFFLIKNMNRGNFYFVSPEMENYCFILNSNKKGIFYEDFFEISEKNEKINNIFSLGFLKNENVKIIFYKGNGSYQDLYHNSKEQPNALIIKKLYDDGNWLFWHECLGYKNFLYLNSDLPCFENENIFLNKPPNNYYIKISEEYNILDEIYMMILFFNSKNVYTSSYEGTSKPLKIFTKTTNDLVIIKNVTSQSNWRLFSRKLMNGTESFILNSDNKISKNKNIFIEFDENNKNCFTVHNSNALNKNNNKYIYLSFSENV